MFKFKQVLVIRKDLGMTCGKISAQVAHAAVSLYEQAKKTRKFKKWLNKWINEGQKKVVVKASGENELINLYEKAKRLDLPVILIQDRGLTEIPPGTTTTLGIGPAPEAEIDKVTKNLPLL
ncbi:MAG: peptidyl-tRNA hydrolase [Candidatus Helarchaeota archaeon]|nr:peptidyl-tRNA hydrolase [Candidatus Helarchaeota archaeon]